MSEVHDQAIHLLATPQFGTYLDPDQREVVLRALEEVDSLRKEIVRLQEVAAASQKLFGVKVARVEFLMHDDGTVNLVATVPGSDEKALAVYCGEQLQRVFDEAALLKDSPAAPKECVEVPSATPLPTEPTGDVSPASSGQEAAHGAEAERGTDRALPEPRQPERAAQVGAEGGDHHGSEEGRRGGGRDAGGSRGPQPDGDVLRSGDAAQRDAEGGALELAPAHVEAPAKWGRADGKGAFHLWREGFSESECVEEVCDGEVLLGDPIPDNSCLSCAAIAGWDVPEKMSKPEKQPELPTIKRTCAGFNKSANVPCGSPNVSIDLDGKWFCKRHDPERKERLARATSEAPAAPLSPKTGGAP